MAAEASIAVERRWACEQLAPNIHRININLEHVGDEQRILCQSDVHWDNPKSDRETFTRHLNEARDHDAPILDNGDFFCAMQGRWDPRSNKDDLRPEHRTATYLDALVSTAAVELEPYKDLLTVRGRGNHETSITKKHETDLTERLVERLKAANAPHIFTGGYSGYIVFQVRYASTRTKPFKLFHHHGYGGGGPVTRGVIQTNRQAVFLADADLVWSGHSHDGWSVPIARVRLNADCTNVEHTRQIHFRTPGYKREYGDGSHGWVIQQGHPPKPIGAAWLVFKYLSQKLGVTVEVREAV